MNFNEDISGVRNAVSTLERENSALRREVDSLLRLTDGCLAQIIQVPSGEPGMNLSMSVIGSMRGPAEAEVGGGGCSGFELTAGGTASALKVNVSSGTIAGQEPIGFTAGSKEFSVSASGVIYAQVTVNSTTGTISGRALNSGLSTPTNTATVFYEQIGTYNVTGTGDARAVSVSNSRCGSVYVNVCRNWYAATAPFFGVSIS